MSIPTEKSYPILKIVILSALLLAATQCQGKTSPCENQIELQPFIPGKWVWVESLRTADGVTDTLNPQTTGVKYFIDITSGENCSFLQFKSDHGLNSSQIINEYSFSDIYFDNSRIQYNNLLFESSTGLTLTFYSSPNSFELQDSTLSTKTFPYKYGPMTDFGDTVVSNKFVRQ